MKFFFNAELSYNGLHGTLDTTSFQWQVNHVGIFQSSFPTRKNKMGMLVHGPEISQDTQCIFRQRYQPVLVAFGVTDMNPHVYGVYISHSQLDAFGKAQSHAVDGEEKDLIAQPVGCGKELVYLIDGQDIRNPGCLWRFYQGDIIPGFIQYIGVKEFQTVQVKLDRAPGTRIQELVEIVKQLVGCKIVNPAVEIVSDTPDGPCVGLNGFWLQSSEFQIFQMLLVIPVELRIIWHVDVHCNLLFVIIDMKGKCSCIAAFFLLQKNYEVTMR